MAALSSFLVFLLLLNVYFLFVFVLVKTRWLDRLGMSLFGPMLMVKTQRGRALLDWFAKARRTFDYATTFGMYLTYAVMFLLSLLLVFQLYFIFQISPEQAPSPRLILGLPGINPIIPIGYGILALIFAVVVHEFSHGILARVHNLRVQSMGLLFLIIPIGAFVEPDEEQLRAARRRTRIKVFSAGPTSNLFFAIVFLVLFSPIVMGLASPVKGAPIATVQGEGPACEAGVIPGWVVTHVGDSDNRANATAIGDAPSFTRRLEGAMPGDTLYVFVRDTAVHDAYRDSACLNQTNIERGVFPVTAARCVDVYGEPSCRAGANVTGHEDPLNRTVIGISPFQIQNVHQMLTNPFSSRTNLLTFVSLPFFALVGQFPLTGIFTEFYDDPLSLTMGGTQYVFPNLFWAIANTFYWLFWINLMLGLTNALPMLPLDGGHMFRDLLGGWMQRVKPHWTPEHRDGFVNRTSVIVALVLVSLVLLQFLGPHLVGLFRT